MMKLRCVLVEDEPPAMTRLRSLVSADPEVEIVGECRDGVEAIERIQELRPQVVFLDIQIPGLNGFDVIRRLSSPLPLIIFVTAYDQFAVQAFEINALDYLLKPFDRQRVAEALSRARLRLESSDHDAFQQRVLSMLQAHNSEQKFLKRIMVKSAGRLTFLNTSEINWLESQGNYVQIHAGNTEFLLRETMNSIETQLNPDEFLRIHRGYMVRLDVIQEIQPTAQGNSIVILKDGTRLPLSRRYRSRLPRSAE